MWNIFKRKPKPEQAPRGRLGLLIVEAVGGGLINDGVEYTYQVEVEAVEDFGDLIRIKIVDVHGEDIDGFNRMLRSAINNSLVKKKDIRWLDPIKESE